MDLLGNMQAFVEVAKSNSFSLAARELGLSLGAVSRRVARLEQYLNARLLKRTSRYVSLTDAGHYFFQRAVRILAGIDETVQAVTDSNVVPEGHLRVHAVNEIGKRYLLPAIADYRQAHPGVTFDLVLDNQIPLLWEQGFDVSVSLSCHDDPRIVSRNVGASYSVLCASQDYLALRGEPQVPEELAGHECLRPLEDASHSAGIWEFEGPYGEVSVYIPPSDFQLNSSDAMVDAVCSGLGVGCVPAFLAAPHLRDGRLLRVLPGYRLESSGVYVSYLADMSSNVCVRSWTAYLNARLPQLGAVDAKSMPQEHGHGGRIANGGSQERTYSISTV